MLQKIDKKKYIFFYLIIFLIFSSTHNLNFKYNIFFIVKKIEVVGLDERDNLLLEKKLKDLIGSNIFTINKESFKFIKSENLINRYNIKKIYPNHIKVYIESAVAISVIKYLIVECYNTTQFQLLFCIRHLCMLLISMARNSRPNIKINYQF